MAQQGENDDGGSGAPNVYRVLQEPPPLVGVVVGCLDGGEHPPHVVGAHGHGGKGGQPEIVDQDPHGLAQSGVLGEGEGTGSGGGEIHECEACE